MKRKEEESQFERDKRSLRQQALEDLQQVFKKGIPDSIDTMEDAIHVQNATSFCLSIARNKIDPLFPRDDDGGEVVAMGTEDANACGLLKDQDEDRLFGKNLLLKSKQHVAKRSECFDC